MNNANFAMISNISKVFNGKKRSMFLKISIRGHLYDRYLLLLKF